MGNDSKAAGINVARHLEEVKDPAWFNFLSLMIWSLAGAVAFLPFAFDTSPWNAVGLHVPGNQGNWWHLLAGLPFFLAFPMIWLRLRSLLSARPSTVVGRRLVWSAVAISIGGTMLVQTPFLLHLAGTSEWQRLLVLGLGTGIVAVSAVALFLLRKQMPPTRACLAGINTAYLANAALCLVVYSDATGTPWSRSGWYVSVGLFWPILFELVSHFVRTLRTSGRNSALALADPLSNS